MRLKHLALHGLMDAFAGKTVALDFDALPAGLIAITGENGAGKSTLLEAAPAALYRAFMSRGDLIHYAKDRDSFVDAMWEVGEHDYRTRVNIDGVRRTSDAVLSVEPGIALNDGKATTYDREVAALFPRLEQFKASAFAAQDQSGSFVTIGKKERRELFAALLGADRLLRLSEVAREVVDVLSRARAIKATIRGERQAQASQDRRVALLDTIMLATRQHADAQVRLGEIDDTLAVLDSRVAVLAEPSAAYEAAQLRVTTLRQKVQELRQRITVLQQRQQHTETAAEATARVAREAAAAKRRDLAGRIENNRVLLEEAERIREAVAVVQEADTHLHADRATLEQAQGAAQRLVSEIRAVEQQIAGLVPVADRKARAEQDAAILDTVPCHGAGDYAGCQFLTNAKAAHASLDTLVRQLAPRAALADRLGTLTREHATVQASIAWLRDRVAEHTSRRAQHAPVADKLPKLEAAEARIAELERALAQVDADEAAALVAVTEQATRARQELAEEIDAVQSNLDAQQDALAQAEAELAGVRDQHAQLVALRAEQADQRTARDAQVRIAATAEERRAQAGRELEVWQRQADTLPALDAELRAIDTDLMEWGVLVKALGREGIPDLEIDAAGPGISGICNDLLQACFDSRFSVDLVTQVARADGKGMKDEFTVAVTDNLSGDVRDIRDLSGGEQVIVAEALMNAIAIYANTRSDRPTRTVFRDETTGALSLANTHRYIAMLRKVQEIGGFHQVLFISHAPEAQALADAQLHIAGGQVTVVLPPYGMAKLNAARDAARLEIGGN